jgi:hypothetical protein
MCGDELYNPETQFCDDRNNYVYKYEKIGSKTWMTEDLKYKSPGCGESSCGLLNPEYNSMYYGPTYAESLCEPDWELPSIDDFDSLVFDPNDHNFAYGGYYDGSAFKNKGISSSLYLMDGTVLKVIQIQNTGVLTVENITNYGSEMHSIRCVKAREE